MHSSICNPSFNGPLTVQYLRANLSAPISNAQLPTPPPRIIGERKCCGYNHCTTKVVDKLVHLGSCISPGDLTKDDISMRIGKARSAFLNLWRRHDMSLFVKGAICNATARSVLRYGSEFCALRD
ncbi:hypothetical protein T265_03989 [Opisthorchis viverrini]|uniref:Uncharacterized protein n=1 Tax=Opisthorchis viverrini TaxID=6198 RepID=A0A074ZPS4_OPIVI|nr:hypothetical protein T265_03989 [Opisthorchis viverrini]KER29423.1 hypothetical protein T265_03989 [Opisthorchis viverrini]